MRYVILVGDGMGDYPIAALEGRTPLEAARTPNLDALAQASLVGLSPTIPPGMAPGSDVANMSLFGYDPARFHTGRAPLEAASLNIPLAPDQVAFRCNLVRLARSPRGETVMADYASGHITTAQARPYIERLQNALGDARFAFHPGTSYRHILVWNGGRDDLDLTPPHDRSGQAVDDVLTRLAADAPALHALTTASWPVMAAAPTDPDLKSPPSSIWLWGQGRPPRLSTLERRFGLTGAAISAVDLIKGLAVYAGLEVIEVPGATGWLDTNYAGKVAAGLEALTRRDFLYLHVEAPDEAGHSGVLENKMRAIEDFDAKIVGPLVAGLRKQGDFRLLVACDHFTPLSVLTHTPEPVPVLIYDSRRDLTGPDRYTEKLAAAGPDLGPGAGLINLLLER